MQLSELGDFETLHLCYHGMYINLKLVLNGRKINHIPRVSVFRESLKHRFVLSSPCKTLCDFK
jgi:hypothetical protein